MKNWRIFNGADQRLAYDFIVWYNSNQLSVGARVEIGRKFMSKPLGSIRRVDCVEAEVVLANGIYLSFRLSSEFSDVGHLQETRRTRMGATPRQSILIDARFLQVVRREVVKRILAHRAAMNLRPAPKQPNRKEHQFSLVLR